MKNDCSIVKDLLPLYVEEMTNEGTASFVKEHLDECEACRNEYEKMKADTKKDNYKLPKSQDSIKLAFKGLKKKLKMKRTMAVFMAIILTLASIFLLSCLSPSSVYYGNSKMYSRQEMNSAISLVKKEFYSDSFLTCKLLSVKYAGDERSQIKTQECKGYLMEGIPCEQCIVFEVEYIASTHTILFPTGSVYKQEFVLARGSGGEWKMI